jgi:predicted DCC family thiol-disulfide oxidoreductase YuxK
MRRPFTNPQMNPVVLAMKHLTSTTNWRFKVLFDGECPFCRLEVRWLQRWDRHGHLAFEDVTAPDFDPTQYQTTREDLLGVIHGVFPDGRIVRKVEVFRQAYRAIGLGWLIAPTGWPVLRWIFDGLYVLFARNRVSLGRLFGRSCDLGSCSATQRKPPQT